MDNLVEALTKQYGSRTDDELQHIASTSELTQIASRLLREELTRRNLDDGDIERYRAEQELDDLMRQDALRQKLLRRKRRLKIYAYSSILFGIAIFAAGAIKFATGQKDAGVGIMLSAAIASPAMEVSLWIRWRFSKFTLRP